MGRAWKYSLNVDAELIPLFVLFISAMKAAKDEGKIKKERTITWASNFTYINVMETSTGRQISHARACSTRRWKKHQVNYKAARLFFIRNLAQRFFIRNLAQRLLYFWSYLSYESFLNVS